MSSSSFLIAGLLFWVALAFFGFKGKLSEGDSQARDFFLAIKQKNPFVLLAASIALLLAAIVLVTLEIERVREIAGFFGAYFMLSVVCGVAGAIFLAAHKYVDN